jgi:glycosyltransferase involved in cell wall biosynthesis
MTRAARVPSAGGTTSSSVIGQATLDALAQRLRAVAAVLLPEVPERRDGSAPDASSVLPALVEHLVTDPRAEDVWLVLTAVTGAYPTVDEVVTVRRSLELSADRTSAELLLLAHAARVIRARDLPPVEIEVVSGPTLIDVDYSARNDKQTGIQRVARRVSSHWTPQHDVVLVAWSAELAGHRRLSDRETHRVLRHGQPWAGLPTPRGTRPATLVVPWHSTVLLTEVPPAGAAEALSAIGQFSGNTVVAIGYDAIPVTSADMRPLADAGTFVRYLTVLKHTRRISGISASSAAEFRGFSQALAAQGLPGPEVTEVLLATEVATAEDPVVRPARPMVLCLGSHELHKNHLSVLHAAETLWREGLDFELHFVGGPGWDMTEFRARTAELTAAGRPLVDHGILPDQSMWDLCRRAWFTVFPSLHEGFGLPVAESLACGTPVVTSGHGSTREIAAGGGCLLVDPRDDDDLIAAVRRLLTDPAELARLTAEAGGYRQKPWGQYADELWTVLVGTGGGTR